MRSKEDNLISLLALVVNIAIFMLFGLVTTHAWHLYPNWTTAAVWYVLATLICHESFGRHND